MSHLDVAFIGQLARTQVGLGGAFVFRRSALRRRLTRLREAVNGHVARLAFPVKTAPIAEVLEVFAEQSFALEVSNLAELTLAARFDTELWLNGPLAAAPREEEASRTTWFLSSPTQVVAACESAVSRLGLRLNAASLLSNEEEPRQFGFEPDQAAQAVRYLHDRGRKVTVLHAHANRRLCREGYQQLLRSLLGFRSCNAPEARLLDVGGGQFLHFRKVDELAALIRDLVALLPPGVELGMESGGAHFEEGIYFLAPVVDIIERSTRYDVVVGACLSAALQWSTASIGYFGASAVDGKPVRIAGASCDDDDHRGTLAGVHWQRATSKPRIGDPIVFCKVSPYSIGRSFSFNGIPKPELIVVD